MRARPLNLSRPAEEVITAPYSSTSGKATIL
nr:MAG TPA: hypothetical protein [Caudoviricetes sp.]